MALDPGVESLVHISSELLTCQDVIKRQRRQLLAMAVALRADRMASVALCDLLDQVLSDGDG